MTSMIYPDSEAVIYTYNVGGLLLSMSGNRNGVVTDYVQQLGYDAFESRVFLAYGNGTQTNYTYEPDRRRLQNLQTTLGNGRRIMDNSYSYDKLDNMLSLLNSAPVPSSSLMGGSSQYSYEYDDMYRLTTATGSFKGPHEQDRYSMSLEYNTVGSITRKTQTSDKSSNGNKWIPQKKTSYDMAYTYDAKQPHAATHIGNQTYTYDADGNMTGWTDDKTGQRQKLVWDEENRLRSVSVNGQLNSYVYDGMGERVLKGMGSGQTVYVNGDLNGSSGGVGNFTVYVNPYLVVKSGEYSNHYFVENQRIATRLKHGWDQQVSAPDAGDTVSWSRKQSQLMQGIVRDEKALQVGDSAATVVTGANARSATPGNGAGNGNGGSGAAPGSNADTDNNGNHYAYGHYKKNGEGSGSDGGDFLYFYHPDHVGSTSYVTDATGEVYQHIEYFAFGETFVEEHSNTERTPYLFNGKELDDATGLYYYGARYYDPRTSIWQSVDPKAGSGEPNSGAPVGWSPYNYCMNNPVKLVDPDGQFPYPIHIRSFAPFPVFGGNFHGDNRGYSLALGVKEGGAITSRAQQTFTVDPTKGSHTDPKSWSDPSTHPWFGTKTATDKGKIEDFKASSDQNGNSTVTFTSELAASNPLVPLSPDIDVITEFKMVENTKAGTLDITATQTGDHFPSAETFISDTKGNPLFIGVSGALGNESAQSLGPYLYLIGKNHKDMMFSSFTVLLDKNGAFTGVKQMGKTYTVAEWNKMVQSRPVLDPERPLPVH
jgi:RHS repeat-associated protein